MYDTIIIGGGPAGMTAGIYAVRREMKTLLLTKEMGGQIVWASEIENYPGFRKIESFELIERLHSHAKDLGVEVKSEEVKSVINENDEFIVKTNQGEYRSKTAILTMGLSPRRLAIPGEEGFTGRGVSYCATCDGPLFRDKIVAVVGGGNSALDAAEILSKIAKQVYLIHRRQEFRGFESLVREVKSKENIELVLDSQIKEIQGSDFVESIIEENINDKKERKIELNGVFVEVGRIAHTDLVSELTDRDKKNQIIINEKGATKTPGLFAAGDVTPVPFKQITIANGQATIAALAAYEYLQQKEGKESINIFDRS